MHALIDGKYCNKCGEFKPWSAYRPNKACRGGVIGTCTPCDSARVNAWYSANKEKRREQSRLNSQRKKLLAIEYMGGKCVDCEQTYHPSVYDFHHIGGKDKNPSAALKGSFESAKAELDKCVLLCANCHRLRHFGGEHSCID